ncbi:NAD(P)-dependent dehydrogenase, short-chain alcohol dehydrogenase family [Sphingomonas laterariae]|uniref:NAD(P)-dependent dehydrogenase, short-chain alcohol dehydrogenase family n=1 Tax=Edaphosphingomonas laterariae TaxID=861865 RepID=A0A239BLK4_9SPHN|nr:SDR family NAD(P)-dependent oxidoreductase [Sphingomonas laterariae]SNS08479.1 NAD(P)-dependent dehydrogenase, short-chain alcohol dehydrogenase family [Sphingomonas laterariae]
MDFTGKTALVTGGASGIGLACVEQFGAAGANVVIADISGEAAEQAAAKLGGRGLAFGGDLSNPATVAELFDVALARFGRIDCAVNAAGIAGNWGAFEEFPLDEWHRVIAVNLTGVFLCMQHEARVMLRQGGGAICNISSGAGFLPAPGMPHYTASKHGVLGLTKVAAKEYAGRGIRVNAVCPGATLTPMMEKSIGGDAERQKLMDQTVPMGRMGRAEEIAAAAVWLCSDAASFVSGESMAVDGASVCR